MRYKAKGILGALGKTNTGKEQVAIELEITDGERKGDTLTWYGFFTEAAIDRTLESLRHLGWEGDDLSNLSGIDRNEVSIVVEDEEFNGVVREKVKWINGGGIAMKETLDDGAAKALAAKLRGHVIKHRQGMKQPQKGAAPTAPHPADSDEPLPF